MLFWATFSATFHFLRRSFMKILCVFSQSFFLFFMLFFTHSVSSKHSKKPFLVVGNRIHANSVYSNQNNAIIWDYVCHSYQKQVSKTTFAQMPFYRIEEKTFFNLLSSYSHKINSSYRVEALLYENISIFIAAYLLSDALPYWKSFQNKNFVVF